MKVVLGGKRAGIDDLIFTFMLLNVFLLVFINEGQSIVELLITVFATVRVLQMSQTDKCIRKKLLIIAGVFVYLFIPTITSGEFAYFYKNIQYMYRPIIVLTYLSSLLHLNPDVFERVLKKLLDI